MSKILFDSFQFIGLLVSAGFFFTLGMAWASRLTPPRKRVDHTITYDNLDKPNATRVPVKEIVDIKK